MMDNGQGIRVFTRLSVLAEAGSYYSKTMSVGHSNAISVQSEIAELIGKPTVIAYLDGSNDGQQWVELSTVLSSDKIGSFTGTVNDAALHFFRVRVVVQGTRPDAAILTTDVYLSRQ